jgi:hypothetical protein
MTPAAAWTEEMAFFGSLIAVLFVVYAAGVVTGFAIADFVQVRRQRRKEAGRKVGVKWSGHDQGLSQLNCDSLS